MPRGESSPRNMPSSTSWTASRPPPPSGSASRSAAPAATTTSSTPSPRREFYQLFAFFNNVPERGKAIKLGNSPPLIKSPTPHQEEQLRRARRPPGRGRATLPGARTGASRRGRPAGNRPSPPPRPPTGRRRAGCSATTPSTAIPAPASASAGDIGDFGFLDKFSCGAWIKRDARGGGIVLSRMMEGARSEGYSLTIQDGVLGVNLVKRWLDDAIRVETECQVEPGAWHHVLFTYDGSRVAAGIKVYVDGTPQPVKVLLDDLNQTFQTRAPLPDRQRRAPTDASRGGSMTFESTGLPWSPLTSRSSPRPRRSPTSGQSRPDGGPIARHASSAPRSSSAGLRRRSDAPGKRSSSCATSASRFFESIPTTMIMREMNPPRRAHILLRGAYDKPGESVAAGVPACLPPFPSGERPDRLALRAGSSIPHTR